MTIQTINNGEAASSVRSKLNSNFTEVAASAASAASAAAAASTAAASASTAAAAATAAATSATSAAGDAAADAAAASAAAAANATAISTLNTTVSGHTTSISNLEAGSGAKFTVVSDTGTSRTLALTDARKYLRMDNASAITVTIPAQADVAWLADTEIVIEQAGAGQVTVAAASGVTLRTSLTAKTRSQYATLTLKRVATNEWVIGGDRATS